MIRIMSAPTLSSLEAIEYLVERNPSITNLTLQICAWTKQAPYAVDVDYTDEGLDPNLRQTRFEWPRILIPRELVRDDHLTSLADNLMRATDNLISQQSLEALNHDFGIFYYAACISSAVVTCDGEIAHIPMLDFQVDSDERMTRFLRHALLTNPLIPKGVLIDSGMSYHFIGTENLLTSKEFFNWLYQLCLSPIYPYLDNKWVFASMRRKQGALRLSTGNMGKPFLPMIVGTIVKN